MFSASGTRLGRRGVHRRVTRLRHGLERATLVRRIALDGLDEVGDEVEPALELHVNLRPSVIDTIAHAHKVVVHPDERDGENDDYHDDDDEGNGKSAHEGTFL